MTKFWLFRFCLWGGNPVAPRIEIKAIHRARKNSRRTRSTDKIQPRLDLLGSNSPPQSIQKLAVCCALQRTWIYRSHDHQQGRYYYLSVMNATGCTHLFLYSLCSLVLNWWGWSTSNLNRIFYSIRSNDKLITVAIGRAAYCRLWLYFDIIMTPPDSYQQVQS